jgi:hypothetical protein
MEFMGTDFRMLNARNKIVNVLFLDSNPLPVSQIILKQCR